MNASQTRSIAFRATSLLASAAITALIVGSQFGIADEYNQRAEALRAARSAQQPVAQNLAAPTQPRT